MLFHFFKSLTLITPLSSNCFARQKWPIRIAQLLKCYKSLMYCLSVFSCLKISVLTTSSMCNHHNLYVIDKYALFIQSNR